MASQRVAIVTGANKGIGYHIAKQLVSSSKFGHVVMACRNPELGNKAASDAGGEFMQLDIGESDSIKSFSAAFAVKYGRLDCLVNNAGTAFKAADPTPFSGQTEPTFKVNFDGTLAVTEILLPLLSTSTDGPRLVNVASMAGRLGQVSEALQAKYTSPTLTMPELKELTQQFRKAVQDGNHKELGFSNSNYGMSKLSLIAATKVLAREYPKIKINACCPGYCDTDMTSHRGPRPAEEGARNAMLLVELPEDGPTGAFFQDLAESTW